MAVKNRTCARCGVLSSEFSAKSSYCRPCVTIRKRAEALAKFGLTLGDFDRMTRQLGGLCPVCSQDPSMLEKGWAIDHCHETDSFRGFICARCNAGIGALGDSVAAIDSAIGYLLDFYRVNPGAWAAHVAVHPEDEGILGPVTAEPIIWSKTCDNCGAPLPAKYGQGRRFCDHKCRTEGMRSRESTCPTCSTTFRSADRSKIYCSADCYNLKRRGRTYDRPPCKICGRQFTATSQRQLYCGKRCLEKSRPLPLSINCRNCSSVFQTRDKRRQYCSSKCGYDGMKKIRRQSEG
ncbi:endonuclease domain-containing protein [Catenuloplanes indicus]|nr:endonuclease domain-containing protein [Catenuloplanes indicus]